MRRIRVHGPEHVRTALQAARDLGRPVILISPPAAAGFPGVGWWRALMALAAQEFADVAFDHVLDCGPAAGHALAAIRSGAGPVALEVETEVFAKIADIAEQAGTRAESGGGKDALDLLGMPAPGLACREWLEAEDTGA
ncbi:MAG: hypothetical protein NVV74_02235 [Magnetospirillum sp.]|nr:hypothetical protein [Magnetospirillum sp.]